MPDDPTINPQSAIRDIELIRSIITQSGQENQIIRIGRPIAYRAQVVTHVLVVTAVSVFLFLELLTDNLQTRFLLASASDVTILKLGLFNLALAMLIGLVALYHIVFRAAAETQAPFEQYVEQHFRYLSNFSFLADLLVKFAVFSLLLLAGKPEWIAALLTLFTADYLFQRRFFVFDVRTSLALGIACLFIAATQFLLTLHDLHWSLLTFLIVGTLSLRKILTSQRLSRG